MRPYSTYRLTDSYALDGRKLEVARLAGRHGRRKSAVKRSFKRADRARSARLAASEVN